MTLFLVAFVMVNIALLMQAEYVEVALGLLLWAFIASQFVRP